MFRRRHFEDAIILLCVRWYLRYSLTYRDLEEIMLERNLSIDHVTIWRWVQRYSPVLKRSLAIDREAEDVSRERARIQASVSAEQRRIVGDMGRRLLPLLETYARDHGYSLVLDTGQENGPVVVALNDITDEIVRLFDRAFPALSNN
jgi:hypothetical protein